MSRSYFIAATLFTLAVAANATERRPVTNIKPLLMSAMEGGEAHGVLVGQAAQYIAQTFKSTAPIEIDVRTVQHLSEPGCKRLAVTTSQADVLDFNREKRETRPSRKAFSYQFNYCRDGRMPHTSKPFQ